MKNRLPNKQIVNDRKWDLQAQIIVHEIGYYQFLKNKIGTYTREQLSKMDDDIKY